MASAGVLETVKAVFTSLDEPLQEYLAGVITGNPVTNVDEVKNLPCFENFPSSTFVAPFFLT